MIRFLALSTIVLTMVCSSVLADCESRPCEGTSPSASSFQVVGTCPDPCNPILINYVEGLAADTARVEANAACAQGGGTCLCSNGNFGYSSDCKDIMVDHDEDPETPPVAVCEYAATANYGGTCNVVE